MLRFFRLMSSAQDKNTETKIEKRKFNTAMEVLHKVSVTFSETKKLIDEKLEQKEMFQEIYICRRGNLFFLEEPRAKHFFTVQCQVLKEELVLSLELSSCVLRIN